jgi:hypothetical protein
MDNIEDLEKQYQFAFQPHYSKKYRIGDPNANKRHVRPETMTISLHVSKILKDPWL